MNVKSGARTAAFNMVRLVWT